jgi:PAS domain S-box-containing protein
MNARAHSELDYRRLVETAHDGIWLVDADARTLYVNPRMAQMLGDTPDQLLGASMFEFVTDEWKPVALRHFEQRHSGPTARHDLELRSRSGPAFWASISSRPFAGGADTRNLGALALVTDVSEQRKRETEALVYDRLLAAGTLAAGVAHEINNPLASVIANLELALPGIAELQNLLGETRALTVLREHLDDARDSARRVQSIIKDLLTFARSPEDERGPVDVRRILDSALQMAAKELRLHATVVKDYADVPVVDANESRLGQVFLNLILNAAQAMPKGRMAGNEIRIACRPASGNKVAITISDTGPGMSSEVQKHLFSPFFTTKAIGAGRGLGLAICHGIVSALGGQISATSQVDRGSTFVVVLPASSAPPANTKSSPPVEKGAPARRGRVLVVDDEVMMTKVISRTLSSEHDVQTTTIAEEALQMLAAGQRFDVILCDLMMPRVTGMEFHAQVLRADPEQARRIVFLTGGAFTPRMRSFLETSTNLCLEKPFETDALRSIINRRVSDG